MFIIVCTKRVREFGSLRILLISAVAALVGPACGGSGSSTNLAPTSQDQSQFLKQGTSKAVTLVATDPESQPISYSIVSAPSNGFISGTPPSVTYTPDPSFSGVDTFTFQASDGTLQSNVATVTLTVTANSAPMAQDQTPILPHNGAKAITLAALDAEGDSLTYSILAGPSHGSLTGIAPDVTYTPTPGFAGTDSFTFQASDGVLLSNVATVALMITNSAPVSQDQTQTLLRDEARAITLVATDAEGDSVSYSIVAGPSNGTLTGSAPNVTYTPTPGFTGTDSFTFQAGDGLVTGNVATVSLTVNVPVAHHLSFGFSPSLREQQNVLFSVFTVEVKDAIGRTLTSDSSTQITLLLQSGTGTLGGVLTVTAQNGIAIFESVTYNQVQSITLKAGSTPVLPFSEAALRVDVQAGPATGRAIVRASLPSGGGEWQEPSRFSRLSGDGRYVSFIQSSTLFVRDTASSVTETVVDIVIDQAPISANGRFVTYRRIQGQVRVYDRQSGLEEFISVSSNGTPSNSDGTNPSISANGRYIAFASDGTNLVPGDTNAHRDIYVRDRILGVTRRVSLATDGSEPNNDSDYPVISGNGRFVAFQSSANNLVPVPTGGNNLYVKDLETGQLEQIPQATFERASLSFDGRFVAYTVDLTKDAIEPTNVSNDVYVLDRQSGVAQEILTQSGALGNNHSWTPSISGDGRYVAFATQASNFLPSDANSAQDVIVHDFVTGATFISSVGASAELGNGDSVNPSVSLDGRFVSFHSGASNLVAGDTNVAMDVFVGPVPPPIPLPASQLGYLVQPMNTPAGASILPAVRVAVQDSAGTTMIGASNSITIEIAANPSGGNLSGTLTVNAVDGVAIFNNLVLDAPGTGYTLRATSPGLTLGTSLPFNVLVPAPADHLSYGVPPSVREQQNVGFSYFTVEVRDAADQLIRSDNSTQVTVALLSGTGTLAGTLTRGVEGGLAVFDDVAYDVVGVMLLGATSSPALPLSGPGATVDVQAGPSSGLAMFRASVPSAGGQWPTESYSCSLSGDGRYVVFLHPPFVYVRDTVSGVTEQLANTSGVPSISGNGRFVAYNRTAGNLSQIFAYDRQTGMEDPVSLSTDGVSGNGESQSPWISGDGRFVCFHSDATNLVPGDHNALRDVFLRDRLRKETIRLSVNAAGEEGSKESLLPVISGNGRFVAFQSQAKNLVPNDPNYGYDVFVYNRVTKQLEFIEAESTIERPAISYDGRIVAFRANTTDVIDPTNSKIDVYRYDRQTSVKTEISLGVGGVLSNDHSYTPALSGDGRYLAFASDATNLVAGDTNGWRDVFLYDAQTGTLVTASAGAAGQQGEGPSFAPAFSYDGRFLGFHSLAENLTSGDTNGHTDILIRSIP